MSFTLDTELLQYLESVKGYDQSVRDSKLVGTYAVDNYSGGGLRYDHVLEYRLWIKKFGSPADMICFKSIKEMIEYSNTINWKNIDHIDPCVLVLQSTFYIPISEEKGEGIEVISPDTITDNNQKYQLVQMKKPRMTEWLIEWLDKPCRHIPIKKLKKKGGKN